MVATELMFRTRAQQIRDEIGSHEKVVVSFGPNVEKNPSPSDPLVKHDFVKKIVGDLMRLDVCPKTKVMYLGKLILPFLCINQAKGCFGCNTKSELDRFGSDFFGRLIIQNRDGQFFIFLSENENQKMNYNLQFKVIGSKDQLFECDGVGGETIISANFQYPQTVPKVVAYIFASIGVSVGLEEVLPIRGNTKLIEQLGDFKLSTEIDKQQRKTVQANNQNPGLVTV